MKRIEKSAQTKGLGSEMMIPPNVQERLAGINKLPTLPAVVENLGEALRDPDVQASRIAMIIEDDPTIMVRIMKVVNSSFYFGNQKATSLKSAIVRLGFQAVSNIALSAAVFSTFPPGVKTKFNRVEFWRHCICTGIAADIVNKFMPGLSGPGPVLSRDALHLCGLLHDIGKIIFEQYFHEKFVLAINISKKEKVSLSEVEKKIIGIDHAQAGAWLAKKWNLSEQLIDVIRWHHEPDNATAGNRPQVVICHLADLLINASRIGNSGNSFYPDMGIIARQFNMTEIDLDAMVASVQEGAKDSKLLMSFLR